MEKKDSQMAESNKIVKLNKNRELKNWKYLRI